MVYKRASLKKWLLDGLCLSDPFSESNVKVSVKIVCRLGL